MAIINTHAHEIIRNALRSGYGVEDIAVRVQSLGGTQAAREARVRDFIAKHRAAGTLSAIFAPVERRRA